ncbi:hypothetical protein [Sandaracinus amylolyticus]|uniref:Uncharacterized protein n=1 Tax=Sandaracinus amylolyticus TaxID=927083 RepID=A0A0F6W1L9_9BACT|nr:hypothetical protein [Sandaracinus amylolyticus]AKF05123.1 hypothetical protein DB32_002272 [Sandaracinus amylolyticus]
MTTAAIVCGLGAFGASVARRLEEELPRDRAPFAFIALDPCPSPSAIASAVIERARALLAHERMVRARDAAGEDGLTELLVIPIAHLGERGPRGAIEGALAAIEERVIGELGPIFEPFRTGSERNAIVAPMLAMPHPHGHADGEAIIASVRALVSAVRARPSTRRCTPQVWLVEDVAEFSILSEGELEQNVRNFVTLLLRARPALDRVQTVLHGTAPDAPLATFACAVAELPRERIRRWATSQVALELLDAVLDAKLEGATLSEVDALEQVELDALDPNADAAHVVRDVLERYVPPIENDAPPRWHESAETIRARYGPDHGDPSLDDPQPPPDQPLGFALERMRQIEDAWRLLQRRRFDDLVARERADMEAARESLITRVKARVDRELWGTPSPDAFRRTTELVDKLRRGVAMRLEDAITERDAIEPTPSPSFDDLRARHAELLDAARRKPDLARMVLWGLLATMATIVLVPSILVELAGAIDAQPSDWYEPWLRARAIWTAGIAGLIAIGAHLAWHVWRAHAAAVEAHREMWAAIRRTVTGEQRSVATYFTTRLRLSRATARVQALLALRATLDRDAEALLLAERAAQRARAELLAEQRALGVVREAERIDLSGLLGGRGETLVEGLAGAAAARALLRQLPADARPTRERDLLRALADREGWARRWRDEVPFSSLASLRAGAAPHAEPVATWDPFAESEDAEAASAQIASFLRRQARSLRVALDFTGREVGGDAHVVYDGVGVVPPAAEAEVARRLEKESASGAPIRCARGVEEDRAYWLVVVTDIELERVASLRSAKPSATPPSAAEAPRFEIEEEAAARVATLARRAPARDPEDGA